MKKALKITMGTALAVSALTPVAAFANEDVTPATVAKDGFYNITTGVFYTSKDFKALSKDDQKAVIKDTDFYLVFKGTVYSGLDIALKTTEELATAGVEEVDFEETHGVELSADGKVLKDGVDIAPGKALEAAIKAAEDAITALPAVDELTLEDEAAVEAAQALVDAVLALDENAVVANVDVLEAAQAKIAELKTPVTELTVESVSAINATQAEVTFSKEVKEVKPANFKVTDKDGNLVFVSKVELNEEKTVATLSFFDKFADKGIYTVETSGVADTAGNTIETSSKAFEYAAAAVSKVEFTATTIAPTGSGTTNIKDLVKVTDALGRDITKEATLVFESSNEAVVDSSTGALTAGSAIVVAKVKVGDTFVKSAPTTITVKAAAATSFAGFYAYTGTAAADTDAFAKLDADKKIDYVYVGGAASKLGLYYKDQFGKSMAVAPKGDVTITNLTPNVVIVEKDSGDNTLNIKSISAGEGFVKVKNGDFEQTIKITVRAEAKVTALAAEKTEVAVGTNAGVNSQTIKVAYKDQFNAEATPAATTLKATAADDTVVLATPANDGKSVTITALKEGATTVELSYKVDADTTLKQTINVTVTKAGDLSTYTVENAAAKLDVAGDATDATKTPEKSLVKVFATDANGNKINPITLDGSTNKLVAVDKDGKADSSIVEINGDNITVEAVKAGTGYVQVKVGSLVVDTLTFEVVDTTEVAKTATFDSVAIVLGEIANDDTVTLLDELQAIVKVKNQDGKELTGFDESKLAFEYTITNNTGLTLGGTANAETITALTEANASADIVVTKVTYNSGTANLISSPVVVKLSAKDTTAPVLEAVGGVVLSGSDKIVTLTFTEAITNNLVDLTALAGAVTVATDGETYVALGEDDSVAVLGKTLVITFDSALSGSDNTIKINANALKDAVGNKNVGITTEAITVAP